VQNPGLQEFSQIVLPVALLILHKPNIPIHDTTCSILCNMNPTGTVHSSEDRTINIEHALHERKEIDSVPQPMEIDGQGHISTCGYHELPPRLMVYYTLVCVLSVWAGDLVVQAGAGPKFDAHRNQLCEVCERRLCRVKGKQYSHPPGLQCHPCYRQVQRSTPPTSSSDTKLVPQSKRVHRETKSDPGEPINLTHKRTRAHPPPTILVTKKMPVKTTPINRKRIRIPPPTTTSTTKKKAIRDPVDLSILLDDLHARRLQLIEAEKNLFSPMTAVV